MKSTNITATKIGGVKMTSEAQKRASAKYEANSVKRIVFKMYPADADIYEHLKRQPNTNDYIRQLIRKDMNA